jgi:hypothetical protein
MDDRFHLAEIIPANVGPDKRIFYLDDTAGDCLKAFIVERNQRYLT